MQLENSQQHSSVDDGSIERLVEAPKWRAWLCNWWNPRFHSSILEKHWQKIVIEFLRLRYRIALLFIGLFTLLWIVFFSVQLPVVPNDDGTSETTTELLAFYSVSYSVEYIVGGVALFGILVMLLGLTFWRYYGKIALALSIVLALVLMASSCALAVALHLVDDDSGGISTIAFVAQFAITAVVILVVYTLSRLPIVLSMAFSTIYIITLEVLAGVLSYNAIHDFPQKLFVGSIISRLLFHVCLNISGITTAYLSQMRLHDTFWHIGQCVLTRKILDLERDVEQKTIHSMMPERFVDELLSAKVQIAFMVNQEVRMGSENIPPGFRTISLPFTVYRMDRVSILFADIVGFTQFSSGLTASQLVGILNDIFCKFDDMALKYNCEKIATLGDCYFCVSGCPEPSANHADNCVDMGLSIFNSLREYREATGHLIKMRVGIHTGSVLCGVMGTKRFKFDVWSHDVTISNRIESVGIPGKVLVSSATKTNLSSIFVTEEANIPNRPAELSSMKLYFASRRMRMIAPGPTAHVWKQKIKSIDMFSKGVDVEPSPVKKQQVSNRSACCSCMKKRSHIIPAEITFDASQPTNSLRDSLSRQSHLQRCVSYTEIANPRVDQQEMIDTEIVKLMEEQEVNIDTYFDPRVKFVTLRFEHAELEKRYRDYGRDLVDPQSGELVDLGFHLTKLSYLTDAFSLFFIFMFIMVGSAVNLAGGSAFSEEAQPLYQPWLVIFIFGLVFESVILVHISAVFFPKRFHKRFVRFAQFIINWYVRLVVAVLLVYYPMTIVVVSLTKCYGTGFTSTEDLTHVQMGFYITIVVLISSINFMEISYLAKVVGSFLSALLIIVLLVAVHLRVCAKLLPTEQDSVDVPNRTYTLESSTDVLTNYYVRHIAPEAAILLMLIVVLLTIVNRMSETNVRLSFMGRIEAAAQKQVTRQQKNQVEWLLFNIIPPQVALELRSTGRYSRNHDCVGVIFASIVNFSDFTRKQSDGDEESFRLLNRIIRELDGLLDKQQFSTIQKIKTIGSTYMAASGLDLSNSSTGNVTHLVQLIDFSLQLGDVLRRVSILVPGFVFLLRVGFNYGPVTSGVVGSRKLMYDIWGDTVNVASRMDTTGQVFKLHMPEECLKLLSPYVSWESHKVINVKGKGNMRTIFVTGRKL